MIVLVMGCQTLVYREVTALFVLGAPKTEGKDPWSKTLNWYFFAVTNYFLYGESIIYYFKVRRMKAILHRLTYLPSACCLRRFKLPPFRDKSPLHQLHALHDRFCWVCRISPEAIPEVSIRLILLGAHVTACHRSVKVSFVFITLSWFCTNFYVAISSSTIFLRVSFGSGFPLRSSFAMTSLHTSGVSPFFVPVPPRNLTVTEQESRLAVHHSSSSHPRRPWKGLLAHFSPRSSSALSGAHSSCDSTT